MKRQFTVLILILISLFSLKCENQTLSIDKAENINVLVNTGTKLIVEYTFVDDLFALESNLENGVLTSHLKIKTSEGLNIEIKELIDTNIPSFKLMIHKDVMNESSKLKDKISGTGISKSIVSKFEIFAKKILAIETINHSSDLVQSIFFHNAVIRTANRSLDKNIDCECTPHPGYFVDKTPFWCQEDYIVDTEQFVRAIIESGYQMNQKEKVLFEYLNEVRKKERFVTIDKLLAVTESKEQYLYRVDYQFRKANNKVLLSALSVAAEGDCTWGLGSDLGCCGNYSGCCWYWSIYCLDHDLKCIACDKWHCGPACEPYQPN